MFLWRTFCRVGRPDPPFVWRPDMDGGSKRPTLPYRGQLQIRLAGIPPNGVCPQLVPVTAHIMVHVNTVSLAILQQFEETKHAAKAAQAVFTRITQMIM